HKPSKACLHLLEKRLNDLFVALEEHPLADTLRAHEPRALQRREMRRDGRLRQAAAGVDPAGADAVVERQLLVREMRARLLEPRENLAAYRVGERLVDCVDVY